MSAEAQAMLPGALQDQGVPFDVFIQALTLQLDKAQAAMALKARVGRLPLTFAVKDVSLDLRAFVQMVNDDVWLRPAGPGDANASTVKLALTTVTKPMIDENAVNFQAEDPRFSIRDALGGTVSEEEQRRLERIGVHTIQQLQELRSAAGADVVARLARMPVNRLQQAMLAASAPRVTKVVAAPAVAPGAAPAPAIAPSAGTAPGSAGPAPAGKVPSTPLPPTAAPASPAAVAVPKAVQVHLQAPGLRPGRMPLVRVRGQEVPIALGEDSQWVLEPLAEQMGAEAEIEFDDGQRATLELREGSIGRWQGQDPPPTPGAAP
jgi:hypothetical protein